MIIMTYLPPAMVYSTQISATEIFSHRNGKWNNYSIPIMSATADLICKHKSHFATTHLHSYPTLYLCELFSNKAFN